MDQGVEKVPDEEDAELGSCRGMEDSKRDCIRCDEDGEGSEEGEYGCAIDYQCRGSLHVRNLAVGIL